jgi:hypothetical protein
VLHGLAVHIHVQIAEMQEGEAIEGRWQALQRDLVLA